MAFNNVNQFPQPQFAPLYYNQAPTPTYVQPQQPYAQAQQTNTINWVQGEAGAMGYPVAPGNTVALFDSKDLKVYFKTVDQTGRPQELEIYDLVKHETASSKVDSQIDLSPYITRDELSTVITQAVSAEVEKAMSEISLQPTSKRKKGDED